MQNSAIKNLISTSLLIVFIVSSGLSVYAQSPLTTKDLNVFSWRNIGPYTFSGRIGHLRTGTTMVFFGQERKMGICS